MKEIKIDKWLARYNLNETWNAERIMEFKIEASLEDIDPLFIVSLAKVELANYPLIEKSKNVAPLLEGLEKRVSTLKQNFRQNLYERKMPFVLEGDIIYLHEDSIESLTSEGESQVEKFNKLHEILDKFNVLDIEKEVKLFCRILFTLYNHGVQLDELRKFIKPKYLELDNIIALLSDRERMKSVNEIIIKTNKNQVEIKDSFFIIQILSQLSEYFLNPKRNLKFHASQIDYKSHGRPSLKKTKALKKSVALLSIYLDMKGKLLPKTGKNASDKRRKFIAELFNALDIDSDKNYIESLLPK